MRRMGTRSNEENSAPPTVFPAQAGIQNGGDRIIFAVVGENYSVPGFRSTFFPTIPLVQLCQFLGNNLRGQRHKPVLHHDLLTFLGEDKLQELRSHCRHGLIGLFGNIDQQAA